MGRGILLDKRLEKLLFDHPFIRHVFNRWEKLDLPDTWLVAGSIAQAVWNDIHGFDPKFGLKDIDIIYFDKDDLSEMREKETALFIHELFADLQVKFEVKNQARVHLWYEDKFGYSIESFSSSKQAISMFPTSATSLGIRPLGKSLEIYAPYGLDDLMGLIVRPNKRLASRAVYEQKVMRWQSLWPKLLCEAW